jgi:cellulose 1,4-beta-cellobiosidase
MWTHKVGTYTNCYEGTNWDTSLCPDPVTCAANCALDSGDYEATYGVSTEDDSLRINFYTAGNLGARVYLMDKDDTTYQMFKLKNREFSVTVDDSQLPCGTNGALYFVEMDKDGGMARFPTNKAGSNYGTGYCDAQCPHDIKFINGKANIVDWDPSTQHGKFGTCCTEMDIWEGNSISQAYTPHSCTVSGQTMCNGTDCGDGSQRYDGVCDKDGGDFGSYRLGKTNYWGAGPSFTVDSSQPVQVVTQFITSDMSDTGDLVEIRRLYVQNGKVINNTVVSVNGHSYDSVTDDFVKDEKIDFGDTPGFLPRGGLKAMGEAGERGMVLVMSLWADYAAHMLWLDSDFPTTEPATNPGVARGSCATTSGVPADLIKNHPDAYVKFSDVKFGYIGSTYPHGPTPPSCPGGSLEACMQLCPTSPAAAYKACVDVCVKDCPSA